MFKNMAIIINKTNPYTVPMSFQVKEEVFMNILTPYTITGFVVDVFKQRIYKGRVFVNVFGQIERIEEADACEEQYIMPGFIDSHVHVESSMLMPSEFARAAVAHGVVATISDPHEIANVLGIEGIEYFIENGRQSGFKFFFGAPSCVPAAPFETSGAHLGLKEIDYLLHKNDIWYLSEMMNFPGVIAGDAEIMSKIEAAKKLNKPVDGHAPCLSGAPLEKYIAAGISTDHECMDICEAEEKLSLGMKILIREGSAAKNFDALYPLINRYPSSVMLCTDDSHPDDLRNGYIDKLVNKALANGINFFNLLKAVAINPVAHYGIPVGLLREGDFADFIVTDSIDPGFKILQTYISGKLVYDSTEKSINLHRPKIEIKNNFHATPITVEDIRVKAFENKNIRVIKVIDKELFTENITIKPAIKDDEIISSTDEDILKIVVLNRYAPDSKPVVGFIKGFGLKQGALAGTVAHDSHNLIAVGADDEALVKCINAVIEVSGGIAICSDGIVDILPLPIAGIISDKSIDKVASDYERISAKAKQIGSPLTSPFMTLSFMALIVIPQLKICDKGLFDVNKFCYADLYTL
jgi:adenine deaminase